MFSQLFERLDPWRLADRRAVFSGSFSMGELPRLRDLVLNPVGEVRYEIRFEREEQGRPLILGVIGADPVVECQRCLQPFSLPIRAVLALVAVKGLDEAHLLPEQYDPLMAEDGFFRPLDMLEEELLLALPQIPKHADYQCRVPLQPPHADPNILAYPPSVGVKEPFAVLARLKDRNRH